MQLRQEIGQMRSFKYAPGNAQLSALEIASPPGMVNLVPPRKRRSPSGLDLPLGCSHPVFIISFGLALVCLMLEHIKVEPSR